VEVLRTGSVRQLPASNLGRVRFRGVDADYGWFGRAETNRIPIIRKSHALAATGAPVSKRQRGDDRHQSRPRTAHGQGEQSFVRYFLKGGSTATFQHFSLTREDNWHVVVMASRRPLGRGHRQFHPDARRNDGSAERFAEGERWTTSNFSQAGPTRRRNEVLIDDVIFSPMIQPCHPSRSCSQPSFSGPRSTRPKEILAGRLRTRRGPPAAPCGARRRAHRVEAVAHPFALPSSRPGRWARGPGCAFDIICGRRGDDGSNLRCHGPDNRHIRLDNLKQGQWTTLSRLARDSRRNDGTANSPFAAGNLVDDLFFLVEGEGARTAALFVDEVVLFDAGTASP
jgi:hypothetical protein